MSTATALADLAIGAPNADPNGLYSGAGYVVFWQNQFRRGRNTATPALNGANGFKLSGVAAGDRLGYAVSGLGDVNGDGRADYRRRRPRRTPRQLLRRELRGVWLEYARSALGTAGLQLSALNGTNGGFNQRRGGERLLGRAVSGLGDVNGDGRVFIGAVGAPNGLLLRRELRGIRPEHAWAPRHGGLAVLGLNGANGFNQRRGGG
ncbi:MAG: hypothetical protein U1F68_00240 [Gammaproteobacteria bacterium]